MTILIAEPTKPLLDVLTAAFEGLNYSVIGVETIEEAQTALLCQEIDAAVIDLPLYPHLSELELRKGQWTGLKLVRDIRMIPTMASMPILVLGTLETKTGTYRRMVLESGANEYMLKPFDTKVVTAFITQPVPVRAAS